MTITCPHCKKQFDLERDEADIIMHQIRTAEFEKEVRDRLLSEMKAVESRVKLESMTVFDTERKQYDSRISDLKDEISDLTIKIKDLESSSALKVKQAEFDVREELTKQINDMQVLVQAKEREIEYYKDLKSKMSTKMIGESLEQHCQNEFNKIRMAAFPNAYFDKDNDVSKESGSKGDYIFRESEDDTEFISIMFEMKNEADTTATKKKNEHFFKELDKDRKEKNCEYAVLVSLLEPENDFYNTGIVDVSYAYPKMYVIRPQFFIPMITLLRNAAKNSLESKKEITELRSRNFDMQCFEDNFNAIRKDIVYNQTQAGNRLDDLVTGIDSVIKKLETMKAAVVNSQKYMSRANEKLDSMIVEHLFVNSKKFKKVNNGD